MSVTMFKHVTVAAVTLSIASLSMAGGHSGPAIAEDSVTISMVNNGYQPGTLTVSVGTTVSWENDEDPNATNELHDIIADDDSFDSPDYLAPGDTFSFMFTTVGTFHYVCDVHNGMEGWITVQ